MYQCDAGHPAVKPSGRSLIVHSHLARLVQRARAAAGRSRGAIDLASILVGVLVLGVVGGVITAVVVTVIPWAQDQGAQAGATAVRTAEALAFSQNQRYVDYDTLVAKGYLDWNSGFGAITDSTGSCYVSGAKSVAGTTFYTTSKSADVLNNNAGTPDTSWCVDATWAANAGLTNLATNPSGEGSVASAVQRTNLAVDPDAAGNVTNFGQSGATPVSATQTIATDKAHSGTTSLKRVLTADGTTGAAARTPGPVAATKVFTTQKLSWSFWVFSTRASSINTYCDGSKVSDATYAGLNGGVAVTVPANTWTKVTGSAAPAVDMFANQCGGYNMADLTGDSVWFDEFQVEISPSPWTFFSGATASAGDLTYAWTGAANASTSTMSAPVATTFMTGSPNSNLVYQTATVLGSGAHSVKGVSNGSDMRVDAARSGSFPVTAGKTYTMLATVKMSRSGVTLQLEGGTAYEFKTVVPSTAGVQKLALTFTSATTGLSQFQVVALSGNNPGDYILVDDILFVEGAYTGAYFDGDSPAASWNGTPHASTSKGYRG